MHKVYCTFAITAMPGKKRKKLPISLSLPGCDFAIRPWHNITPARRQSKTLIQSTNVDQKSIEPVFSNAICRATGDKWQSKTLFLSIFDPRSSIVNSDFGCHLPGMNMTETVVGR